MIVTRVVLKNWCRYRGRHELELEAGSHSVVAQLDSDEGRSNWLGKSSLMWAVPFALFGLTMSSHRFSDDWITSGETSGAVVLEISDGAESWTIERSRARGKSTKLIVTRPNGSEAKGKPAQELIDDLVGLSADDFLESCFFEQKRMSALVVSRPKELTDTASKWFRLGPLREGVEILRSRTKEKEAKIATIEAKLESLLHSLVSVSKKEEKRLADATAQAKDRAQKLQAEFDQVSDTIVRLDQAQAYADAVTRGREAKKRATALDPPGVEQKFAEMKEKEASARAQLSMHKSALDERRQTARDGFNGVCPVACAECPARDWVDEEVKQNQEILDQHRDAVDRAREDHGKVKAALDNVERKRQEIGRCRSEFEAAREIAAANRESYERCKGVTDMPNRLSLQQKVMDAWDEASAFQAQWSANRSLQELNKEVEAERRGFEAQKKKLDAEVALLRKATAVFERAQRDIAETALREIEGTANDALSSSGVDLSLAVSWAREGKGLESHCSTCGHPFPASAKARTCWACGASRGKKMIEELDIQPSDRSGAADDLAGVAFQLAAASWLRRSRGARWSTVFVDEPFSALDRTNRKAFGSHLATLLSGRYGFRQAFVTAHQMDVLDAFPKRVEIAAGEDGSRL